MRYKDHIEQEESLYLPDLPKLISPDLNEVTSLASEIKSQFENFSSNNIKEASINLFNDLEKRIKIVSLPIQFWQKPSETLTNEIGDELDYYSLLCSSLIALGCFLSKVFILNTDGKNTMLVYYEHENEVVVFKHGTEPKIFKNKELFLKYLIENVETESIAYEFNDKIYRDIILPLSSS